jgi:hypothetical protein
MTGIVHGATKHVEHTPIDGRTADRAQLIIQSLRVGPPQVGDSSNTQFAQVASDTWPDTRDLLQLSRL